MSDTSDSAVRRLMERFPFGDPEAQNTPESDGLRSTPRQPTTSSEAPQAPPQIPGHTDLTELGEGGMGKVYKAKHTTTKRVVALKVIRDDRRHDGNWKERFREEAQALAKLSHPNIIQLYDADEHEGHLYFSQEFAEHGNLHEWLRTHSMSPKGAAEFLGKVARAVHHAHLEGVVHRDLKPKNIFLAKGPLEPKVGDFGLARLLDTGRSTSESGKPLGTPQYMPPEQVAGVVHGPTADVYGLCAVLYHVLTGRPPFQANSTEATLELVLTQLPTPPRQLNRAVPPTWTPSV